MTSNERASRIHALTDLDRGPGLEIAPLNNPLMLKSEWDVKYVDIVPTADLIAHSDHDPHVSNEDIVEVDFPLTGADGTIRSLSEVAGPGAPYAWVLASHVIEHVPDLIGWLDDIASLLRDDGALVLAVPDTRYTFDIFRPQTTVGQMLQAHEQGDVVPSIRAVYDYLRSAVTITAPDAWAGRRGTWESARIHELPVVLKRVENARQGTYVDSHVWTFRPQTLIEQINELGRLSLCEFTVETVRNTRPNELEFYAVLRRLPRDRTPEVDATLRARGKSRTDDSPERFVGPGTAITTSVDTHFAVSARERRLIERKRAAFRALRRALGRNR